MILAEVPANGPVREPFGFVDGISDPIIRGVGQWTDHKHRDHLVEAGEFILGYPDNSGKLPVSPSVFAVDDPDDITPATESHPFRERPEFAKPQPTSKHDLGRNGTFLVVRQLEQNVEAFTRFCRSRAHGLQVDEEWVAAKLMGRWRGGASLVRHPNPPKAQTSPDNDFLYGAEDVEGIRCPFGAHIRRANPRDTLDPGLNVELSITNRHRILRVGRSYEPQEGLAKPGLIFMCLNADIERQFEFVQQTWLLGRSFNGLEDEIDPITGHGSQHALTVPMPGAPLRFTGMQDFAKVLGSGYFFLPGKSAMQFLAS